MIESNHLIKGEQYYLATADTINPNTLPWYIIHNHNLTIILATVKDYDLWTGESPFCANRYRQLNLGHNVRSNQHNCLFLPIEAWLSME